MGESRANAVCYAEVYQLNAGVHVHENFVPCDGEVGAAIEGAMQKDERGRTSIATMKPTNRMREADLTKHREMEGGKKRTHFLSLEVSTCVL